MFGLPCSTPPEFVSTQALAGGASVNVNRVQFGYQQGHYHHLTGDERRGSCWPTTQFQPASPGNTTLSVGHQSLLHARAGCIHRRQCDYSGIGYARGYCVHRTESAAAGLLQSRTNGSPGRRQCDAHQATARSTLLSKTVTAQERPLSA